MKRLTWLMIFVAVAVTASKAELRSPLDELSWMVGSWRAEDGGVSMEELWTEARGGVMLGLHRDVHGSGNAFFEYLRIELTEEGEVDYVASPRGGAPTAFRMILAERNRVEFRNPEHDFPQSIVYWLEDERRLCARIQGNGKGKQRSAQWCWQRR